jgi:serine/threonine-protein kinase
MAPEQATGRNDEIDARTDVFAFGAMTFEMLAGRAPFTGDTLAAVIHAIVYTPTPSLAARADDVPPAIVAAVERAMEKNRDARFPDVNSFVKAVTSRSLATAPTVASPEKITRQDPNAPTERIPRPPEPSRTPVFIAFGIAVLVSVAFTVWKLKPREPEEPVLAPQTNPRPPTTPTPTAKPAANTNAGAETDTPAPPRAEKTVDPTPEAEPGKPATAKDTPRAAKAAASAKSAASPKETSAPLSPEAARDLDEAEAALAAGKPGEAVRLAQHSLYTQKSSRAYVVMTKARCAQGDLGNAKAALTHVSARERSQVVRECGKLGVELH